MAEIGFAGDVRTGVGPDLASPLGPNVRLIPIPLDTARNNERFSVGGLVLYVVKSVGSTAQATIKFNSPEGSGFPALLGVGIRGLQYHSLFITNDAQPGLSITLLASMAPIEYEQALSAAAAVEIQGGDTPAHDVVTIGATATLIVAARAGRHQLLLRGAEANTEAVYFGGSGITVGGGPRLKADEVLVLDNYEGPLYGIRNAAAQDVEVFEGYRA